MTIETKIELLKYKIFIRSNYYERITFRLINFEVFSSIIEEIDDNSFYVENPLNENKVNADQFLSLLNYFVKTIKDLFYYPFMNDLTIKDILNSNTKLINEYFHYKGKINLTNNHELDIIIYKLLITNFINNAKYIDFIELLLSDNHLKLKNLNDYSDKEIHKIVKIISDIIFCEKQHRKSTYLFLNINESIESHLNALKERRKVKYEDKEFREKYVSKHLQSYIKIYESIINNYNRKKQYLKYFN